MSRWFTLPKRSRDGRNLKSSSRRSAPVRLEALEDRMAPATFNVTTLADGGPGSLRAAILQSDATTGPNTIDLMVQGTYLLTLFGSSHDGTHGALQITNQSVTIANASDGSAVIDGGGVDRVFDIEGTLPGGVVAFIGVTITGGLASANSNRGSDFLFGSALDGAGIYSPYTNLILNSCAVSQNQAGASGGGIWTDGGNVTLNSSTITGNDANLEGGGIYSNFGAISVTNSSISGNVAFSSGGGISTVQSPITLTGSDVGFNTTNGPGGGISMLQTGNLVITNSTITDNVAGGSGGGISRTFLSGTTSVKNSTISGNTAHGSGGGFYGGAGNAVTTMYGSTISGNLAVKGGGGAFYGNNLIVGGCTITGNLAQNDAGGLLMNSAIPSAIFYMHDSTVNNNSAGGNAGGIETILTGTSASATINYSAVDGNRAGSSDGGAFFQSDMLGILGGSINNNRAAIDDGGLFANINDGGFTYVNVIGNHSGVATGGLGFSDTILSMYQCNVSDNSAGANTGGLFAGGATTLTVCTINGNRSGTGEGGINFSGTALEMSDCTVSNNTSGGGGGGLGVAASAGGSIASCTISDNSVSGIGGGLLLDNSSSFNVFTITDCSISRNRSGGDGGGIFDNSSSNVLSSPGVDLSNDTFFGNAASLHGGGIAFEGGATDSLDFVTIAGNSSVAGGGVFRVNGSTNVRNTIIGGNNANLGPDVNGLLTTQGNNFVGVEDVACTGFSNGTNGDQVGTAANPKHALLGSLENNGGPTFTMMLRPGSSAIAAASAIGAPNTDQRGFARPAPGQELPSIGAVEPQLPAAVGNTAKGAYVENLYETLLGRTADAGAAGFVTFLANGGSPPTVVADIIHSTEFASLEVRNLYQTYLLRNVDPGGLQHFSAVLGMGGTVEQVALALVSSPEYLRLHGGTNDDFLTALYYDALGRGGSPAEQAGFLQGLNTGSLSRAQVAAGILSSAEYKIDVIESFYRHFLGRDADPAGLAGWLAALQSGTTDFQLEAALLGSGEAFANRS